MIKLKITEEQYARLKSAGLIKESTKTSDEKPEPKVDDQMTKETRELIKYFYRESKNLSEFWGEHDLTYDDICKALTSKNLIVKKGDKYMVPRTLGSNEEAIKRIENELRLLTKMPENENEMTISEETDDIEEVVVNNTGYDIFVYNDELIILKSVADNKFFLLDLNHENIINYEGEELSEEDIFNFLNSVEDKLPSILIPIDLNILSELSNMYDINKYFTSKLEELKTLISGSINEDWDDYKGKLYRHKTPEEEKIEKAKIKPIRDKELASRKPMATKTPEEETPEDLEETSAMGGGGAFGGSSTGQFTGPLTQPIKREIKTVSETTVAGAGNFQYDAPGLVNIGRNGEYKKGPKTKAEVTPQISGGSFVEQPECSKLNNNKEAQNGGCSSGASTAKSRKAKGSITTPSLGENKIFEEVAKQTGKTIEEVMGIIKSKK